MKKLLVTFAIIGAFVFASSAQELALSTQPAAVEASPKKAFKADVMVYKLPKFALHYKNGGDKKITVSVYNEYGREVFTEKIKNIENLSKTYKLRRFPEGTYTVKVMADGEEALQKEIAIK